MSSAQSAARLGAIAASTARHFATSARSTAEGSPSASKRAPTRRQPLRDFDLRNLEEFKFDDATSLGYLRLEKIREAQEIVQRVEVDRPALEAQRKSFTQPRSAIRISQTVDLSDPHSLVHRKRVLHAPVSSLPLGSPESIQRFKLLAGPRWTPGPPGRNETRQDGEGWFKISEEQFPDGLMNRRSLLDCLERLVEEANNSSTLPASTPLDPRHLQARQSRKKRRDAAHVLSRSEAMSSKPVVGGVRGFPEEWLK